MVLILSDKAQNRKTKRFTPAPTTGKIFDADCRALSWPAQSQVVEYRISEQLTPSSELLGWHLSHFKAVLYKLDVSGVN